MITIPSGSQVRAARSLLGISAKYLVERSGIGIATLRRIEATDGFSSVSVAKYETLAKIFLDLGVEFIPEGVKRI